MISGDRSILQGKLGAFWYTLQELRKHWDRIDIICPRVPAKSVSVSESGERLEGGAGAGGDVFFHACPQSLLFQIPWIVHRGAHLIQEHGHDVMTVHEYPPFYNGIGAKRLHKKTGIPYVIEVHHIVGWPRAATFTEWIGKNLSRWYLARDVRSAGAVRVVNNNVQRQLIAWGIPENKIAVVSSFYLDKDILNPINKPPVSYDVSFCGRLVPNKGLPELLEAIAQLRDVRLLIIGDGPERQAMERKAKSLGISNRVTFLGWLPTQEAVSGAIQTARMFVMNSRSEGGPRVALEAMGCGMPVIVTKVGVMPEVIKDGVNGVFTTGEPDDLVKKIGMMLLNETGREAMSAEAKNVLKQFDRETLIRGYADFLKRLV